MQYFLIRTFLFCLYLRVLRRRRWRVDYRKHSLIAASRVVGWVSCFHVSTVTSVACENSEFLNQQGENIKKLASLMGLGLVSQSAVEACGWLIAIINLVQLNVLDGVTQASTTTFTYR